MSFSKHPVFYMLFFAGIILLFILIMQPYEVIRFRQYIDVLFPQGIIGIKERNLLLVIQVLMLFVIIPVYILTFVFSWKYRADNPKGKYDPDLVDHPVAEVIWWGVPLIMVIAVGILTWIKTYELDPYRTISGEKKPLNIQVVATQWNWLFIYPEEKVASLNFFQFPVNTPLHFEITADAPMNSLWIPDLGGQIYAMPKMRTELNLIADKAGDYRGSSANLSGVGFAGMVFTARASTEDAFHQWIQDTKSSGKSLDFDAYNILARPSMNTPVQFFNLKEENLFNKVIMKFTQPVEYQ